MNFFIPKKGIEEENKTKTMAGNPICRLQINDSN